VSVLTVLLVASIIQLSRSRRKWKRLALSGVANKQHFASVSTITSSARYVTMLSLMLGGAMLIYILAFRVSNNSSVFHSKSNKSTTRSEKGGKSQQRLQNLVIIFGQYELDKTTFCALVSTSVVLLVALGAQIGIWCKKQQLQKLENATNHVTLPPTDKSIDVVIIGCGPKSVGWFHLMQFLDMPNVNVRAVVEPFFLDTSRCPYPPQSFVDLVVMLDDMGIRCVNHVGQLDIFLQQTLCIIAGRTSDNPRFFRECIGIGASHIYLESPGAPTIDQLQDMQSLAETRGVEVYMGYQRLCASYIQKAVSLSRSVSKAHVFFCHNEVHQSNELNIVVSRHPEGMIFSMAIQELAVLVMQLGVKANEIETFKVNTNRLFSERLTFYDENNDREVTDLSRIAFKITTKDTRRSVSIMADRCGGVVSFAVVKSHAGKELQRFQSHSDDQVSVVQSELRNDKEISHQFEIESEEYIELKRRVVHSILSANSQKSYGLVSIRDGVDILDLATYCTGQVSAALIADD
jgi:predicted dehydrogenase